MSRLLNGTIHISITILKCVAKVLLFLLTLAVDALKLFLLLFGLVARIFLAFVGGTKS